MRDRCVLSAWKSQKGSLKETNHLEVRIWRSACISKVRNTETEVVMFSFHILMDHSVQTLGYTTVGISQALGKESSVCEGSEVRENISVLLPWRSSLSSMHFGARVLAVDWEQDTCIVSVLVFLLIKQGCVLSESVNLKVKNNNVVKYYLGCYFISPMLFYLPHSLKVNFFPSR